MNRLLLAATAALAIAPACFAAPAPDNTLTRTRDAVRDFIKPQMTEQATAGDFKVPPTKAPGGWIELCITELRYVGFTDAYRHSGFGKTPGNEDYFFAVLPDGVILSPSSQPAPAIGEFVAPATPDLWGFLREAADGGKWVQFYAWAPDDNGVQRVTQVRRQYPGAGSGTCSNN